MKNRIYNVKIAGLAEAVTDCTPGAKHADLVKRMRSFESFYGLKLATTRGGDGSHYLAKRKVLKSDGC